MAVVERPLSGSIRFWSGDMAGPVKTATRMMRVYRNGCALGIPAGLVQVGDLGPTATTYDYDCQELLPITRIERSAGNGNL